MLTQTNLIFMKILPIAFALLVCVGYTTVGLYVLKFQPMQNKTLDSLLGYGAILYALFRLVRIFFKRKETDLEQE
jgi:hypothetical protein